MKRQIDQGKKNNFQTNLTAEAQHRKTERKDPSNTAFILGTAKQKCKFYVIFE